MKSGAETSKATDIVGSEKQEQPQPQPPSEITILIENPGKGKNWGPLLRCCAAFGIETIYVVGYDKCDVRGSHGASKHVRLVAFPTHEQASVALTGGSFELVGLLSPPVDPDGDEENDGDDEDDFDADKKVMRERFFYEPAKNELEIVRIAPSDSGMNAEDQHTWTENQVESNGTADATTQEALWNQASFPAHLRSRFPKRTCLVVDKMKLGLPWSLAKHCSSFVHILHANYNPNGSMLTLEASLSIVLHEAMNAGLVGHSTESENETTATTTNYVGQKYHVEQIHKGGNPSDMERRQRKRKEREDKLKELQDEATAAHQSILFGDGSNYTNDGDY